MAAKDNAYCVNVDEASTFSSTARVNRELMATGDAVVHLNCYEPSPITPMHKHPEEDEVLYIVEGAGFLRFETKDDLPFKAGDLVCLPGEQYHSIHARSDGRMRLLYFMQPGYKSARRLGPQPFPEIKRLAGEREQEG